MSDHQDEIATPEEPSPDRMSDPALGQFVAQAYNVPVTNAPALGQDQPAMQPALVETANAWIEVFSGSTGHADTEVASPEPEPPSP